MFAATALFATTANAQMQSECISPDFTATDLNGTTWHLYDILNSGKTVYIDISATWCGPCWNYHNTGNLENLYNTYGPPGTDEVMVFYIEGDHATTLADLNGTGSNTQGDWVTGTPYPIIDDNATLNLNNAFDINYFPTIYMICPDRTIREVGQMTTANLYAQKSICTIANVTDNAGTNSGCVGNTNLASCTGVDLNYRLINHGTATMTSATIDLVVGGSVQQTFNWTGSLNTYDNTTLSFVGVTGLTGQNTAEFNVTNVNGVVDPNANDNGSIDFTIYPTVGGGLVSEQYTVSAFPPANWTLVNGGDQGYNWEYATVGSIGAGSAKLDFYSIAAGDVDKMLLPSIDMTGYTTASLSFDVAHARYSTAYTDNLKVKVSTDCGTNWTQKYNKSGAALATAPATTNPFTPTASQWRFEPVDLSQFAGNNNVFISFEGTSGFGNNLYVDNVNVTFTTGVNNISEEVQFGLYPNPASENVTVSLNLKKSTDVTFEISNVEGQIVQSQSQSMTAGVATVNLNTKGLAAGSYFVAVKTAAGKIMKPLMIQ